MGNIMAQAIGKKRTDMPIVCINVEKEVTWGCECYGGALHWVGSAMSNHSDKEKRC